MCGAVGVGVSGQVFLRGRCTLNSIKVAPVIDGSMAKNVFLHFLDFQAVCLLYHLRATPLDLCSPTYLAA